jgi:hypothetical protein
VAARRYNRSRDTWGRNATLELLVTVVIVGLVIAGLVVFLVVYHDLPFRISTAAG